MFKNRQHISLLFLLFFIFIKTVGLHALSHSGNELNINDCDLCELVIISNDINFTNVNQNFPESTITNNHSNYSSFYYNYLFAQEQINCALFCRPPPTI